MDSNELLDALKAKTGVSSDYALALQILKVDPMSIRDMRKRGLGDARVLQIATLLEIDPGAALAAVHAERAKDPAVRKVWESLVKTLASRAAAAFGAFGLLVSLTVGVPQPVKAAQNCPVYTLCEVGRLRRFWLALRALAGGFANLAYTISPGGTKNMAKGLAALALSLFALSASADVAWSVQVNGLSWHADQRDYNGDKLNSINTGLGVQITSPAMDNPDVILGLTAGTLINSMGDRSWYAGPTVVRRWGDVWQFEAGMFLGALTYPSYEQKWLIIPAPFLSFGTRRAGINAIVMPPISDLPAAVMLQLRIGL